MSYTMTKGFFDRVNGLPVTKRALALSPTSWIKGHPIGIAFHYTVGCRTDISGTLKAKGYGATFNVGTDGAIEQYRAMMQPSWHLFVASRYYVGIEHASLGPGTTCELTDVQLEASAKLSAAIIEWNKDKNGYTIPLTYIGRGCEFKPGFVDHRDFQPCEWNTSKHSDHLFNWSWDKYLTEVTANLIVFSAIATRGDDKRTRKFESLKEAFAWGRELLLNGWRVSYRKVQG